MKRKKQIRRTPEERAELQNQALQRARSNSSVQNEAAVIMAFVERGIPEPDIQPRINVLTFNAWKAEGRSVKKGERGVPLGVVIDIEGVKRFEEDGQEIELPMAGRKFKKTYVFHVSQTEPVAAL